MNSRANVVVFETAEHVALAAAERFADYAVKSIEDHGLFAAALSGGNTPRRAYQLLATDPFKHHVDWPQVHLFFADERIVPPDSEQSNYRMVRDSLLARVPIPPTNIHRIAGEVSAEQSAELYKSELRKYFGEVDWPRFDLIWLGMGVDGHTASLFPGANNSAESSNWVVQTINPDNSQPRVSLTLPLINHAARINFIVTGVEKAATLARVLSDTADKKLPAQAVAPVNGLLEWLVDRDGASAL